MKKIKILFVCASMKVGGAEKSLVNLLNLIDYSKYDVDLLLLQKQGAFLKQMPEQVKILELKSRARALYNSENRKIHEYLMSVIKYVVTFVELIRWKEYDVLRAHRWKDIYSKLCENVEGMYDVVVAFQSGEPTYYAFDKVKSKRYVTFFHTDISNIKLANEIERNYLKKADLIATISTKCVESIRTEFPELKGKVVCLENLSSKKLIIRLAGENQPEEFIGIKDYIKIVSVGRLVKLKGYDMVVDAAKILRECRINFQWFIIGEGEERKALEKQIREKAVEKYVHLIGMRENPYPYIKYADIIVQSSRYEGKSVVLDEAKILEKPIIVTNYNSVEDQVLDGINGLICNMDAEGIAERIKDYIQNPEVIRGDTRNYDGDIDAYMDVLLGIKNEKCGNIKNEKNN